MQASMRAYDTKIKMTSIISYCDTFLNADPGVRLRQETEEDRQAIGSENYIA